jgi:Domain of unknown function (DUF6504)
MESQPLKFIDEPIDVIFKEAPALTKSPTCPASFTWRGEMYTIVETLETWQNFERRGRMERNMRPSHRIMAARRGSWGVGRFHFRVRVEGGRIFEIYYDRAPQSAGDRMGHWFLLGERRPG